MRLLLAAAAAWVLLAPAALAQHNHDHDQHAQYHAFYQNWMNGNDKGCCNDKDCRPLAEAEEQEIGGRLFVHVRGVGKAQGQTAWCPVRPFHYLKSGNAPNASVSHACVSDFYGGATPCDQFICYQPRPLF